MSARSIFLLYGIIVGTVALAEATAQAQVALLSKPLAMPLLWIGVRMRWRGAPKLLWQTTAILTFSWIGDVLLLFAPDPTLPAELAGIPRKEEFFLGGLGAFLVAQLLYIRVLWRGFPASQNRIWLVSFYGIGLIGLGLMGYILVKMGTYPERLGLRLPVALYGAALTGMGMSTVSRWGRVPERSFWPAVVGGLLFMASDALIGFHHLAWERPGPYAGVQIFLTYGAAQALLTYGLLQEAQGTHAPIYG